jgi:hypothetical protein
LCDENSFSRLNLDNNFLQIVLELHPNDEAERAINIYGAISLSPCGKGCGDKDWGKSLGCRWKEMKTV